MPKNSTVPAILLLCILVTFPMCIHSRNSQGYNGPAIFAGMYRGKEGRFIASIKPEAMKLSNQVTEAQQLLGKEQFFNFQQGLEGPYWSSVLLHAQDDHPVTRSVVKGLAELFTGVLAEDPHGFNVPFTIVHLQPHDSTVRPWGVPVLIRIETIKADNHPEELGAPFQAEVSISIQDGRMLQHLRSFAPVSAGGVREAGIRIVHKNQADIKATDSLNWANWHATMGRSIAADAVRHYWNGEIEPLNWQVLDYDVEFGPWLEWFPKDEGAPQTFGKKTLLPVHPDHKVVTWFNAFQEPLVRGWTGSVIGTKRVSKMGTERDTVAEWNKFISKSGSWSVQDVMNEEVTLWESIAPSPNKLNKLMTVQAPYGADVISWMENPHGSDALYQDWIKQAEDGDEQARILLRRYLLSAAIDADLRKQAIDLLRQQASLADSAIIGLHPQANPKEKQVAEQVHYVRGVSDNVSSAAKVAETNFENLTWDGLPMIIKTKDAIGVLLSQRLVVEKQTPRIQIWWRSLSQGSAPKRSEWRNDRVQFGNAELLIKKADQAWQVSLAAIQD